MQDMNKHSELCKLWDDCAKIESLFCVFPTGLVEVLFFSLVMWYSNPPTLHHPDNRQHLGEVSGLHCNYTLAMKTTGA